MTQEEIKNECQHNYDAIKNAQDRLAELRKECKHPNTFEGNYSWRVGASYPATICADCGECVKINFPTI